MNKYVFLRMSFLESMYHHYHYIIIITISIENYLFYQKINKFQLMRSHGVVKLPTHQKYRLKRVYVVPLDAKKTVTIVNQTPRSEPEYNRIEKTKWADINKSELHIISRKIINPEFYQNALNEKIDEKSHEQTQHNGLKNSSKKIFITHKHKIFDLQLLKSKLLQSSRLQNNNNNKQEQKNQVQQHTARKKIFSENNCKLIESKKQYLIINQHQKIDYKDSKKQSVQIIKLQPEELILMDSMTFAQKKSRKKLANTRYQINKNGRLDESNKKSQRNMQQNSVSFLSIPVNYTRSIYKLSNGETINQQQQQSGKKSHIQTQNLSALKSHKKEEDKQQYFNSPIHLIRDTFEYPHQSPHNSLNRIKNMNMFNTKLTESTLLQVEIITYPKCLPEIHCRHD